MDNESLKKLLDCVRDKMCSLQDIHNFDHVLRVYGYARILTQRENANPLVTYPATILHDVGRVIGEPHNEKSSSFAKELLQEYSEFHDYIDAICECIINHRYDQRGNLNTIEEKIVWDADKLDLIGPIGILRAFHYRGGLGTSFNRVIEYWQNVMKDKVYHDLNTASAIKFAYEKYKTNELFFNQLKKDLEIGYE